MDKKYSSLKTFLKFVLSKCGAIEVSLYVALCAFFFSNYVIYKERHVTLYLLLETIGARLLRIIMCKMIRGMEILQSKLLRHTGNLVLTFCSYIYNYARI